MINGQLVATIGQYNIILSLHNLVSCRKKEKLKEKGLKIVGVSFLSPLFKN